MNPMALNRVAEVDVAYMYWVKDVPYVPHYTVKDVFVAPCGVERTENQILDLGGVKHEKMLWPRAWQKK